MQNQGTSRKSLGKRENPDHPVSTLVMPERNVRNTRIFTLFVIIAKANIDQTSVRSHSPDIADDINKEIAETGMRLANLAANSSHPETSVNNESNTSMRDGENSERSGSSEGSLNKRRAMKSNIALQNKIKSQQGKYKSRPIFYHVL